MMSYMMPTKFLYRESLPLTPMGKLISRDSSVRLITDDRLLETASPFRTLTVIPFYFIYLGIALLPIFIGLFFKKRFAIYECLVSITFIVLALTGTHASQILALLFYIVWQIIWVYSYKRYRSQRDNKWVFYLHSFLVVLPLILVKVEPIINGTQSLLNFLGISYLPPCGWYDYRDA